MIKNSDLLYSLLRSSPVDHVNDLYRVEFKIRINIKIGIKILLHHGKLSALKFLRVWPHRRALYEQSYWTVARERTSVGLVKPSRWPTAHALGSVEHSLQLPGSSSSCHTHQSSLPKEESAIFFAAKGKEFIDRKQFSQPRYMASWLLFSGVRLWVIVNDWKCHPWLT